MRGSLTDDAGKIIDGEIHANLGSVQRFGDQWGMLDRHAGQRLCRRPGGLTGWVEAIDAGSCIVGR
jgi:hypothetical protein